MLSFQGEDENLSLKRFERMLKTNDTYFFDSAEFERIIVHYLDQGKLVLAEKAVALALEQHPTALTLQLFKAEILMLKDKLKEALIILNKLATIETTNEDIFILKASLFSKQDKHQEAVAILLGIVEFAEDKFEIYNLVAMEYLFLDNFEKALKYFISCLKINQKDTNTLYNVAYCYEMLEKDGELIQFLNNYIDQEPYNEIAWHLLGRQYFEGKEYDKALRAFDYAILIDDKFIGALVEKAKTYEKIGDYKNAAANYHITLELDDPTAFVYLRLGVCYQEMNNSTEAIQYFNKAILEDPQLIKAWVAIITFYMERNENAKALLYAKRAVDANETSDMLWKVTAAVSFEMQLFEESELAFDKCLAIGNYEKSTYLHYIDVLLVLGKKEKAVAVLLKAKEYYDDAIILYLLAAFSYDLNNVDQGSVYLMAALEEDESIYKDVVKQFEILTNYKAKKVLRSYFKAK